MPFTEPTQVDRKADFTDFDGAVAFESSSGPNSVREEQAAEQISRQPGVMVGDKVLQVALEARDKNADTIASDARAAAAAQDWLAALDAWREYNGIVKGGVEGILGQADAYRGLRNPDAADAVLNELSPTDARLPEVAVSYALNAQVLENWDEALARWHKARIAFPNYPAPWVGEAAMLQLLGRAEEADEITRESVRLFPNSIDVLAQHCNTARALSDWPEADRRLTEIETQFPDHDYTRSTVPLIRAEINAALRNTPNEQLTALALKADAAEAWPEAVKLWQTLYIRDPEIPSHIIGLGRALRESKRYDDADKVLLAGIKLMPEHTEIWAHYAQVAAIRLNWPEAAQRWQETLRRFPDATILWVMASTAYREAGLLDLADQLLERAIALQPDSVEFLVEHALTAQSAGNWSKAVASWNKVHKLRPDDLVIQNIRGDAIWQETIARLEDGTADSKKDAPEPVESDVAEAVSDADLLKQLALRFEGLGDNCEFGIVQRRFGADPIGLFRFAAIGAPTLTVMLREKLERLGDPAFTELGLTGENEYLVRDTRNLYHMHSFVKKDSVDPAKFLKQQITRLGYLKRKIFEDLESAAKIFVYKASLGISDEDIIALHDALAAYGPNMLLVVKKISEGQLPGSLHILSDRIIIGYVGTLYDSSYDQIDFKSWRQILEATDHHRKTHFS
jgi:tetratricopeptide (TPR) repeat protein